MFFHIVHPRDIWSFGLAYGPRCPPNHYFHPLPVGQRIKPVVCSTSPLATRGEPVSRSVRVLGHGICSPPARSSYLRPWAGEPRFRCHGHIHFSPTREDSTCPRGEPLAGFVQVKGAVGVRPRCAGGAQVCWRPPRRCADLALPPARTAAFPPGPVGPCARRKDGGFTDRGMRVCSFLSGKLSGGAVSPAVRDPL